MYYNFYFSCSYHATTYVDRKLSESYCPNKTIEWKRSWTLPVFTPKTESKRKNADADNFDRTTYLYDDGTDIDSACLQSDKNKIIGQEPCTSMVGTLCTMGATSVSTNGQHLATKPTVE
ncbi:unnamed protein product [Acanthoscelides obtectus]|uniref:Uncharacterized protein n=1 Tax=Acanthoscelides obtectus TaxID=200917 RepID=A0A9P0PDY4_ACAOB|nr:unnamed protein product [Acanthoscelides obtectus]CAK1676223.1 hypothetical protein AOBTE_LOCUS30655 [Acanthoscelides obtectus]